MSIYKTQIYPDAPGYKARDTSREAAEGVAPKARSLRARVFDALRELGEGTPEAVAAHLGEPLMNVRPRFSECAAKGDIVDTGRRGLADGGRKSIIWRCKDGIS